MQNRLTRLLPNSIRGRVLLLTAAVVFPAAVLASLLVLVSHQNERVAVERQLTETARAMSLAMDRELGKTEALLKALATSSDLARHDYAAFHRQAEAAVEQPESWVVMTDREGRHLVNTFLPLGAPLPQSSPHFEGVEVLASGRSRVSDFRPSATHPKGVLSVSVPVFEEGKATYVLALLTVPSSLSEILADQDLPRGWVAAIIDRNGTVVARNVNPERYVGGEATADIRALLKTRQEAVVETVNLDGDSTLAAYSRSPNSGWTVIIGAPKSQLLAPALRLLLISMGVAFTLVAVGIVMSIWIGRGVVRSVDALVSNARAIGRSEVPAPAPTGMYETDQVAHALHASALQLKAREDDLKNLNETLEARVSEAAETLVQARKLEAVGRLTGGVAHDFNNLLTAIGVSLDLLARRVSDDRSSTYIRAARQATDRGAKLTAQLLAFARKQRLQPEPVDVNAVVEAMGDLLRSTLGGAVRVEQALTPELPAALADRTQLELIIMNLAINARDAMREGGSVRIETARAALTEPASRPESPKPGDYIVISVVDTGSGMPAEVRDHIFEPFFTTKAVGEGSGLGLPQVLGVVQQLGGGIRIDSQIGRGTRVSIYLPLAAEAARTEAAAEEVDLGRFVGLRVMLIDDDLQVRTATAALLRELGSEVVDADSGASALEKLLSGVQVDVALVDYAMPGMNGAELAAHFSQLRPGLPVLLMSGYLNADTLKETWTGAVLQKPFTKEGLARRLAEETDTGA